MSAAATVAHDHDIRPPAGHGKLRVLLVEDNPADIELVSRELRRGGLDLTMAVVETEEQFTARVRSNSYQVVVADHNLPQWRGLDAVNALRHETLDVAKRMQSLVQDLLALSRAGRTEGEVKATDCNVVVELAIANLQVAIRESEAQITYDHLPIVLANSSQIPQVFQNLIGNAVKFRGPKTPQIQITAERQENEWVFSVADNGIGIAPEYCQDIFVIFKRLHTRTEYPGNGIGLAICCRKIIEQNGGRIWVTSQEGGG